MLSLVAVEKENEASPSGILPSNPHLVILRVRFPWLEFQSRTQWEEYRRQRSSSCKKTARRELITQPRFLHLFQLENIRTLFPSARELRSGKNRKMLEKQIAYTNCQVLDYPSLSWKIWVFEAVYHPEWQVNFAAFPCTKGRGHISFISPFFVPVLLYLFIHRNPLAFLIQLLKFSNIVFYLCSWELDAILNVLPVVLIFVVSNALLYFQLYGFENCIILKFNELNFSG